MKNLFIGMALAFAFGTAATFAQVPGNPGTPPVPQDPPINPVHSSSGTITVRNTDTKEERTWNPGDPLPPGGRVIQGIKTGELVINGRITILCENADGTCVTIVP